MEVSVSDIPKVNPDNIDVDALHKAYVKACADNDRLRRRVADLEDFLRAAAKQFDAMAGKP
jgi:hypothetical protein